jgi:hypothetical protein
MRDREGNWLRKTAFMVLVVGLGCKIGRKGRRLKKAEKAKR